MRADPVPNPESDPAPGRPQRSAAIAELAKRCSRRGFAIAYDLLRDPNDAEDAVQEALARACSAYSRLRNADSLDAWFYRTLTNGCLNGIRRRKVVSGLARLWPVRSESRPQTVEHGMLDALRRLPAKQQAALVLRYAHDCSVGEVASMLGVKPGTAKTHLARGLRQMRAALGLTK